jgi:xylulokinase
MYLLGIDVGTTGTRALLVNESDGAVAASATSEYPLYTPKPQWAEQDPEDWWRGTTQAVRQALQKAGASGKDVRAIGLSGQMHGVVLLDATGQVLRRSIIWADQRSQAQCDWITQRVGAERLIRLTCNPALTGFSAPKLLWIRDNEPEIYARARKFLLPKDYIRYRLTGEYAGEVSDCSGTSLFDVSARQWSAEVLHDLEIDRDLLPAVYESPEVSGKVTTTGAEATGLAVGTPVVGGGGDQAAGGVGNGVVEPGILSATIGSSGVLFAHTEQPTLDPKGRMQTFCHAVPGAWHVMGVTQGAGLSLRWWRDNFGADEMELARRTGRDAYEYLTAEAAQAEAGADGLLWLPYLMGERAPHLDPDARGVLFGLTMRSRRQDVLRAVLEGVAYSLRDSLEILRNELGLQPRQVRASGGGAVSILWRQIMADIFQTEIVTLNIAQGPAYGVALLAGVGSGVWASVPEACHATLRVIDRLAPDPQRAALYDRYYQVYRALYPALKESYKAIARLVNA